MWDVKEWDNGMDSAVTENAWVGKKTAQISQEKEKVNSVQCCRTLSCQWSLAFISSQLQNYQTYSG